MLPDLSSQDGGKAARVQPISATRGQSGPELPRGPCAPGFFLAGAGWAGAAGSSCISLGRTLVFRRGPRRHPLGEIVCVRAEPAAEPERYLLHKRDKGDPGTDLKSLVYVRSIQLGAKALEEGKRKAAGTASQKASAASGKGRS